MADQEALEKEELDDLEENIEESIDLSDEREEGEELRDEVVAVYEQIRNLVVNLKRSKPSVSHKGQSLSGTSLHTSLASSESSDHGGMQFKVGSFHHSLIFLTSST